MYHPNQKGATIDMNHKQGAVSELQTAVKNLEGGHIHTVSHLRRQQIFIVTIMRTSNPTKIGLLQLKYQCLVEYV
jgi:hypothetical protein